MAKVVFNLPIKGIHKGGVVENTPALNSGHMSNVRARDVLENKIRIGQRPGLDKWGDGDLIGDTDGSPPVAFCVVSSVS
ncbi:MAG: hypothetical protein JRI56_00290 [Deltaproteobacteria bacterium]|nr:hypothetical protein [Deltaproteobacteria bacterium]